MVKFLLIVLIVSEGGFGVRGQVVKTTLFDTEQACRDRGKELAVEKGDGALFTCVKFEH